MVTKEAGVGLASEVLMRDASRKPSRPVGLGVGVDLVRGKVWAGEMLKTGEGKGVTDAEGTLPLITDGEEIIAPKPTLPLTVMRTWGRG